MAKRMVTQFSAQEIPALRERLRALRQLAPPRANEPLGVYFERAGAGDEAERQRLVWGVAVLGDIARSGADLRAVERFHVWLVEGTAKLIVETVYRSGARR